VKVECGSGEGDGAAGEGEVDLRPVRVSHLYDCQCWKGGDVNGID
jgi:hypothetical protein